MLVRQSSSFVVRWRYIGLCLSICLLVSSFILVSCSNASLGGSGSSGPKTNPTPTRVALSKLHWCNKSFIVFRDEHAPVTVTRASGTPAATATATTGSTPGATATTSASGTPTAIPSPTTLTDWSQIKPNLGFTVYLPPTLPGNTCLVSASGTLNDPIFGGNFIIGYLLPDNSPLSLSEAPMRTNNREFQCTSSNEAAPQVPNSTNSGTPAPKTSPTSVPALLCTGVKDNTSIVFSERGSEASLKQFFDALQPDVTWVPRS